MNYELSYRERHGLSESHLTEAQKALHYVAENMRMQKSISVDGYHYFQQAIEALDGSNVLGKIRAEIERERSFQRAMDEYDIATGLRKALEILDKYKTESKDIKAQKDESPTEVKAYADKDDDWER